MSFVQYFLESAFIISADFTVALIMNEDSKKYGKKDMIKIENVMDIDLDFFVFYDVYRQSLRD